MFSSSKVGNPHDQRRSRCRTTAHAAKMPHHSFRGQVLQSRSRRKRVNWQAFARAAGRLSPMTDSTVGNCEIESVTLS
jgi:hypothetical protein